MFLGVCTATCSGLQSIDATARLYTTFALSDLHNSSYFLRLDGRVCMKALLPCFLVLR